MRGTKEYACVGIGILQVRVSFPVRSSGVGGDRQIYNQIDTTAEAILFMAFERPGAYILGRFPGTKVTCLSTLKTHQEQVSCLQRHAVVGCLHGSLLWFQLVCLYCEAVPPFQARQGNSQPAGKILIAQCTNGLYCPAKGVCMGLATDTNVSECWTIRM